MSVVESTYFGLTRVREQGPETRDWAVVDRNPEVVALILKAFEQHAHTGVQALRYPGFNSDPLLVDEPTVTEFTTGGILPPGTTVGVRLAYVDARGLETDATPEKTLTLASAAPRPLTPQFVSITGASAGQILLSGGTYIYAITKRKGSGETVISDVLPVDIPYDTTYSVTIKFDAINTYTDGTDGINIYRSAGLSSAFQLVGAVVNASETQFTDTNNIPAQNATIQPPTNNTFDAAKKVRIDWANIDHPTNASKLRVYITQQSGLWSTDHLLQEVDLTGAPQSFIDYLGSESLRTGWPLNTTQSVGTPPKLNLGTEAIGAPILTEDMDFNGFKALNFVLGSTSASQNGGMWYDASTHKIKGLVNGAAVDLTPIVTRVNAVRNPSAEDLYDAGFLGWSVTGISDTTTAAGTFTHKTSNADTGFAALKISATMPSSGGNYKLWIQPMTLHNTTIIGQELASTKPGEYVFGGMSLLKETSGTPPSTDIPATSNIRLKFRFYDAAGAEISGLVSAVGTAQNRAEMLGSDLIANGWTRLQGAALAPTGAAFWTPVIEVDALNAGATYNRLSVDSAIAVPNVGTEDTTVAYFDGDSMGAQWKGLPHASQSVSGPAQHGVEEAGGHRAQNITFGSGNIATVLSRIANPANAGRKQVIVPVKALVGANNQQLTSTTPVQLLSLSMTPEFDGQWFELLFSGHFSINTNGAVLSVGIAQGSNLLSHTTRSVRAVVDNQDITIGIREHMPYSIAEYGPTSTWNLMWWVTAGAVIAVEDHREFVGKLVF